MKNILKCILIIQLTFSLCACSSDIPEGHKEVKLYFTNQSHSELVEEMSYIPENDFSNAEAFVTSVMKRLLDGPKAEGHFSVIPENIKLRGVSFSKSDSKTVNIDLEGEFYEKLSESSYASDELLARYSIVCTLCQHEKINKVKFYVNGSDLKTLSGKGDIVHPISEDSVLMNSPSSVETQTEKFVTLYFIDKDGEKLFSETRKATMTDSSLERTIVSELIRGPVSEQYERTFSSETEIISIETTEGVCFVNFSADFMTGLDSGSKEEMLAVYSVVNSLTNVAGIEKVQILIDGKKPENDKRQLFSTPLERNQKIIHESNIS